MDDNCFEEWQKTFTIKADDKEVSSARIDKLIFGGNSEKEIDKKNKIIKININDGKDGESIKGDPTPEKWTFDSTTINAKNVQEISIQGTAKKEISEDQSKITMTLNDGLNGKNGENGKDGEKGDKGDAGDKLPYLPLNLTNQTPWFKSYYGKDNVEFKGNLKELITYLQSKYQDKPFVLVNVAIQDITEDDFLNGTLIFTKWSNNSSSTYRKIDIKVVGNWNSASEGDKIKITYINGFLNLNMENEYVGFAGHIGYNQYIGDEVRTIAGFKTETMHDDYGYSVTEFENGNVTLGKFIHIAGIFGLLAKSKIYVLGHFGTGLGSY